MLVFCVASSSLGQETVAEQVADAAVSLDVESRQAVLTPGDPIFVRFLMHNRSALNVTAGVAAPVTSRARGLPPEAVLGSAEQPALQLFYTGQEPPYADRDAVPPLEGALASEDAGLGTLILGPGASTGVEIDLQQVFGVLRYSGRYEVVWRPQDGAFGTARTTFTLESRKEAIIVTDYGKITFELLYEDSPKNVANFLELVRENFYDGLDFHAIVPGQIIQGGDPAGDGTGMRPDGATVPAEFESDHVFQMGTLGMSHKPEQPDSASAQFFITLTRLPELDGKYTPIGQARDEQSYRTLLEMSAVTVDENYEPRDPVVIRSITLVDTDRNRTRVRELGAERQSNERPRGQRVNP